ncbi:MAG: type II toxin-antitoxin system VapC family toxin [Brevundimonas sp.]|nr:type II toxin-antitoxin system VapC family toxin [Brevundimonas sp.]MDP3404347.1 type II toxin-antitoxin system VapC family toxin [Brevundimonas sp.]
MDTHILLWSAQRRQQVPATAALLINDENNVLFFSAASIWEIAVKKATRSDFETDSHALRRNLLDNGYVELPIWSIHTLAVERLPMIHRDPFDRILIAQALTEGLTLVTSDHQVARYPGPILKV